MIDGCIIVAFVQNVLWNLPRRTETAVEINGFAGIIHHENAVSGGFEGGLQKRNRVLQFILAALAFRDVAWVHLFIGSHLNRTGAVRQELNGEIV